MPDSSYSIPYQVSQWLTLPPRAQGLATVMAVSTSTVTTTLVAKTGSDDPLVQIRN